MSRVELEQLRETWRQRVAEFRASGQSGAAWCAAYQIKESQLWYWVRRFPAESPSSPSSPRFVPVGIHEAGSDPLVVRVGQAAIEIRPGYDPQLLCQVVQTLSATC